MQRATAIYIRVSLKDQNEGLQVSELRDYCKRIGYKNAIEFTDIGKRGSSRSRPELDKMLRQVRTGAIERIVVWRYDRATRDTLFSLELLKELDALKVNFISYTQNIDTSTPEGRLMYTVVSGVAEYESKVLGKRIKAGMAEAKRNGQTFGPKSKVDKEKVLELKKQGHKTKTIAEHFHVSPGYVRRIIRLAA